MADTLDRFQALKQRQEAEAAKLSAQATTAASRAISPSATAAALAVVLRVQKDEGRGAVAEPSADLRTVRGDAKLNAGLATDLRIAEQQAALLLVGALSTGYASQINGTPLNGAKLTYTPDAQTQAALAAYPILGETSAEHARALTEALRRDILRATGLPLTGQADPAKVAEAIGLAVEQHATRVGTAVSEAYFAGTQAGTIDASRALAGAL